MVEQKALQEQDILALLDVSKATMSQSSGPSANAKPMKCEDKQEGDLYQLFEQDDLPFRTTEFAKFLQMVQAAEKEGDGKGYVSVRTL